MILTVAFYKNTHLTQTERDNWTVVQVLLKDTLVEIELINNHASYSNTFFLEIQRLTTFTNSFNFFLSVFFLNINVFGCLQSVYIKHIFVNYTSIQICRDKNVLFLL